MSRRKLPEEKGLAGTLRRDRDGFRSQGFVPQPRWPDDARPGWLERIREAQSERFVEIRGVRYARIAHDGVGGMAEERCLDCAAAPGELHVEGCANEPCPRCRAVDCGCLAGE